jgi:uncharacterized protein
MRNKLASNKIFVAKSKIPNSGRGVFAANDIKKGEIIEECPVIKLPKNDAAGDGRSHLVTYIYYLGKNRDKMVLTLGFGSIYNHSYKPNAKYAALLNEEKTDFIALTDIKKGEEITVNYNQGEKNDSNPMWFE